MDWRVFKIIIIILAVVSLSDVVFATSNDTCNCTQYIKQIQSLNKEISKLKAENLKLQAEVTRLKNQLSEKSQWDVHKLMDALFMFTLTPQGKQYKLLFHEGGLGGVVVYQYVGYGLGDAGKYRQYKQIAFFKPEKLKSGYLKPGIVLKPVWGFNGSKEVRIKTIGELIKYEKEYNSIKGLIEYYKWMFDRYTTTARYDAVKVLSCLVIGLCFGLFVGEFKKPIGKLRDYLTIYRRVTDFRLEHMPEKKRFRHKR